MAALTRLSVIRWLIEKLSWKQVLLITVDLFFQPTLTVEEVSFLRQLVLDILKW